MKKGPYPRIAQALGVEVGERFVYKDPNKEEVTLYVEENGMVVFIFKDGQKLQDIGMDYVLVQAINHPDRFGFLLGRKLRLLDDLFVCSWCRRRSRKRDEKESPRRGGRTA